MTEGSVGWNNIRKDYAELFQRTSARRFILGDIDWNRQGSSAQGKGAFEVQIKPMGSDRYRSFSGTVTFKVSKSENGLLITELKHDL